MRKIATVVILAAFMASCSSSPENVEVVEIIPMDTLHFVDIEGTAFTQVMNMDTKESGLIEGNIPQNTGYKLTHPLIDTVFDAENRDKILFIDSIIFAMVHSVLVQELKSDAIESFVEKTKKSINNQGLTVKSIKANSFYEKGYDQMDIPLEETVFPDFMDAFVVEITFNIDNGTQVFEYPVVFLKDLEMPQKQQ